MNTETFIYRFNGGPLPIIRLTARLAFLEEILPTGRKSLYARYPWTNSASLKSTESLCLADHGSILEPAGHVRVHFALRNQNNSILGKLRGALVEVSGY